MPEQFLTRRERREAERRAADAAFEAAQHPDGGTAQTPDAAAEHAPQPTPAERAAREVRQIGAPAKPTVTPAFAAAPQSEPQHTPETTPAVEDQTADEQSVAEPEVAEPEAAVPDVNGIPEFTSRSARKRYLRERGLGEDGLPLADSAAVPGPAATDSAPGTEDEARTESVTQHRDEPAAEAGTGAQLAARPQAAPETVSAPAPAKPEPEPTADPEPTHAPKPASASQPDAGPAPAREPEPELQRAPVAKTAPEPNRPPEPKTEAPATPPRRAPVVATPTTAGIRVVDSAVGPASRQAGRGTGANPQTMPISVVRAAQAGDDEAEITDEVWPDGSPESRAVGKPMKASDVTNHDGAILMGERFSATPFIVLGIAALVAIVLIVVALTMLF